MKKIVTLVLCCIILSSCKTDRSKRTSDLYVASRGTEFPLKEGETVATNTNIDTSQAHAVSVGVSGFAAPHFILSSIRFLGSNSDGSANLSFTFGCGEKQKGVGASASCSSLNLTTQLDYILVRDAYLQKDITVAQANEAFAANKATGITTTGSSGTGMVVDPGASDLNGNVLPYGGFYTSNATPLVTGTTPIFPNNLNYVVMLRARDTTRARNTQSYLYFYVNIPGLTQE